MKKRNAKSLAVKIQKTQKKVAKGVSSTPPKTGRMQEIKNKFLGGILIIIWSYFLIIFPLKLLMLKYLGTKTIGIINSDLSRGTGRYARICNMYEFEYKGTIYEGNSQIPENQDIIGDTISVVFLDFWPSVNRPASCFE